MSIEQTDNFEIPSDPGVLLKIKNGLQTVADSKLRQKAESDLQTETFNKLAEETGVPNRTLRKLATVQAEGMDKARDELDKVEALMFAINKGGLKEAHEANIEFAMNQDKGQAAPAADQG